MSKSQCHANKSLKTHTKWYVSAMEHLVDVVQQLSQTQDMESLTDIVRKAARELTGADGATFVLREQDQCYYVEENAISPLWKGKRFPMTACISGWCMLHKKHVVLDDIYKDSRIPQDAYRPTFVKSLVMVPIRRDAPIGAIGNYWAVCRHPSHEEVQILQALADTTSVALENIKLYDDLKAHIAKIQEREARIRSQHETLEIFTRALAHDLKEPARTIHSFSEVITKEQSLTSQAEVHFKHIQNASARMLSLIDTIFLYMQLDHESAQNAPKQRCEMQDILQGVLENLDHLIQEKRAMIRYDDLPMVYGNATLITQLFQNLISNAIYYNDRTPEISISARSNKEHWVFSIRDNGVGINKNDLPQIFLPFKRGTTHREALGLGLAVCKRIIESHGGSMWCESKPEVGTTVYFTFPKTHGNADAIIATPAPHVFMDAKNNNPLLANVLLVDDLEEDIEFTQIMLRRSHIQCNLIVAHNGEEALNVLFKQQKPTPIDLVLLDINMPGMNGFDVLERLKRSPRLQSIPVVMFSGSTYDKDQEQARAMGAVGYLIKPLDSKSLKSVIERLPKLQWQEIQEQTTIRRLI